jgi:hypothetical protein
MAEKEELDQDARTVPRKSGATTKWYFMWLNPITPCNLTIME